MRNNTTSLLLVLLGLLITFASCSSSQEPKLNEPLAKHVIVLGFDGFGAYSYDKAEMPRLKEMARQGSMTLKARTVLPSSSAVNWASMFMASSPTIHGYTEWGSKEPEIPSIVTSQYGKFPSIYTLIKEQRPDLNTALIYSWAGIGYLFEKDIISTVIPTEDNDSLSISEAVRLIKEDTPDFMFIHINEPDVVGHNIGHDTPEYYEVLKLVDQHIGKVLDAIKEAGIEKETILMVTADHGGIDAGHGGKALAEVEIPIVVKGPGIKVGHEVKDPIIICDIGATLARMLNVKEHNAWRGKVIEDIFE